MGNFDAAHQCMRAQPLLAYADMKLRHDVDLKGVPHGGMRPQLALLGVAAAWLCAGVAVGQASPPAAFHLLVQQWPASFCATAHCTRAAPATTARRPASSQRTTRCRRTPTRRARSCRRCSRRRRPTPPVRRVCARANDAERATDAIVRLRDWPTRLTRRGHSFEDSGVRFYPRVERPSAW